MADNPGTSKLATTSSVAAVTATEEVSLQPEGTVRVKLKKPKADKQVKWCDGTVDNENMNKKKSKCCCIYKKPRAFDESSSSDSDEECMNCYGHKAPKSAHDHEPADSPPVDTPVNPVG